MTVSLAAIRAAVPGLSLPSTLPEPLVPAEVDLRDVPIPREAFARAAALHFGIDLECARAFVDGAADLIEGIPPKTPRQRRRRP